MGNKKELIEKRVISISGILHDDVTDLAKSFHIDQATIYKMAIIHGIKQLDNKYIPKENKKRDITQQVEICLPQRIWDDFDSLKQSAAEELEQLNKESNCKYPSVPEGKLIELFINSEVRNLKRAKKHLNTSDETTNISVRLDISKCLYDELQFFKEDANLSNSQMYKYLLVNGFISVCSTPDFNLLETDTDLYNEIKKLGLSWLKTITLLQYLLQSNRITWNG